MVKKPTSSQATRIESETACFPCKSRKDGAISITGTLFNIIGEKILECNSGFRRAFKEAEKSRGLKRDLTTLANDFLLRSLKKC